MPASVDTLVSPRTVAGLVAERLRAQIVAGELPAGTKLRQVEIARRFDVSTTPVREALAALQREGLVRLHPQRGAVVFLPSVEDLREHYEIRGALEAVAAARAAERFEAPWAEPLEALLQEMRDGPAASRYIELNQRFHTELYERSERPRLVEMIAGLRVERLPAHLPCGGGLPRQAPRRRAPAHPRSLRRPGSRRGGGRHA
jgi:DNA-binding GntR family transcriptional regulator